MHGFDIGKIRYAVRTEHTRTYRLLPETLAYYDITIVTDGVLHYRYNGIPCDICAGDAILFPPGSCREREESTDFSSYMSFNFFSYGSDAAESEGEKAAPSGGGSFFGSPGTPPAEGILRSVLSPRLRLLLSLYFECLPPQKEEQQYHLLSLILYELERQRLARRTESRYTTEIKEYIHAHYGDPLSVEVLASLVHLHPTYCGYVFRRDTGCTVSDYLCQVRIEEAKNHLRSGTAFLKDIPSLCGFSGYKYFSNVFKKKTGMSPLAYRKSSRK